MAEQSFSSGGVVVNPKGLVAVVTQPGHVWSLPKGKLEQGEDNSSAALREITEETGLRQLRIIEELGHYERYKIGLNGGEDTSVKKFITIFLCTTPEENLSPIDPDQEEARWVEPDKVADLLTHTKDKEFYLSVLPKIKEFISSRRN